MNAKKVCSFFRQYADMLSLFVNREAAHTDSQPGSRPLEPAGGMKMMIDVALRLSLGALLIPPIVGLLYTKVLD